MPYTKTFETAWVNSFANKHILTSWELGGKQNKSKSKRVLEHLALVATVEPELNDEDIDELFQLATASAEKNPETRQIQIALTRQWIQNAAVNASRVVTDIKNQAAHTARYTNGEETIVVMLDNDQLKHQPREHPIGNRQDEGEKFPAHKASPAWHEDNTMQFMALWAANTPMKEGGKLAFKQGDKYLVGTLPVSFEGSCQKLNNEKYVLFHCYPNSRQQVQTKAVPWVDTMHKI
ncbi:MAG: hypothetical protein V4732_22790 [Pseudomonadota bacterium]